MDMNDIMVGQGMKNAFEAALGIAEPWTISKFEMSPSNDGKSMEVHIKAEFKKGSKFIDPAGGELCEIHDTREHTWRHLNFFQFRCYVTAKVPRINTKDNKVKTVEVPWARKGSGFTLLMEGVILTLIKHMSVASVAREIGEVDNKIWRVLKHYISEAKASIKLDDVESIGVDEYSHKGHNYITVFLSHASKKCKKARVIDIQDGKGLDTVTAFKEEFIAKGGNDLKVENITSDMCHGYRNAMTKAFPNALLTVDKFHVIKMMSEALDNIRKRELRSKNKVKIDALSKSRYLWLKNRDNLTDNQKDNLDELLNLDYLDTVIAYNYRLRLQEIYSLNDFNSACYAFEEFTAEVSNSSIKELQKLGKSLTRNAVEILNYFISRKTNAILEGFNSKISIIKNRARGFRNMENFKNMIFFCMGELDLPFIPVM